MKNLHIPASESETSDFTSAGMSFLSRAATPVAARTIAKIKEGRKSFETRGSELNLSFWIFGLGPGREINLFA